MTLIKLPPRNWGMHLLSNVSANAYTHTVIVMRIIVAVVVVVVVVPKNSISWRVLLPRVFESFVSSCLIYF